MENGWYIFYSLPPIRASHIYSVQGTTVPGGCRYSDSLTLAPGSPGVAEQEVAEKPSTCQVLMERGLPSSSAEVHGIGGKAVSYSDTANGAVSKPTPGNIPQYYTAHSFAKFTDPPGKTVTSSYARLDWQTNGYTVVPPATGTMQEYWLSGTGWTQDWSNPKTWLDFQAHAMDSAKYHNPVFCFGQTTYNEYDQTQINGNGDGTFNGIFNFYKWGACNTWLSPYHDVLYGP